MTAKKADGSVTLKANTATAKPRTKTKVAAPTSKVVEAATPVVAAQMIKKPVFLDQAVARSGVKRKDAKLAIEAALEELGAALLRGDELNLPPLGKIKVIKDKPLNAGAHALTLKVRTMKTQTPDT